MASRRPLPASPLAPLSFFALLLLLLLPVHAHIAFNCDTPIEHGRVDPIVNPGQAPAGHSHVVFGSSGFGLTTDTAKLQDKSACSTCPVPADRSAYWCDAPLRVADRRRTPSVLCAPVRRSG